MLFCRSRTSSILAAAFLIGGLVGGALGLAALQPAAGHSAGHYGDDATLAALKAKFRRPDTVPFPADNPYSDEKRALGAALFHDPRLSGNGKIACASCHEQSKGFADGRPHGSGAPGRRLARHTPTLWNLAWARQLFWDGRARDLEEQVAFPIQNPDEMAQSLAELPAKLGRDPSYASAFAAVFPDDPKIDAGNIAKAIATYERTLVSPRTRFDDWIEGDPAALTQQEVAGFRLFTGKAGCSNCHSGWRFTDSAFYDIGLPGDDRGRGRILRLSVADHAFKTPGLREIGRSGPYMHDGSLATLGEVIDHYEHGIVQRRTLAPDLPHRLRLSEHERQALIAFLATLTSRDDPKPPEHIVAETSGEEGIALPVSTVSQDNKAFHPGRIRMSRGQKLWVVNNDSRTHNVRVFNPKMDYDSGAQEPGETVEIPFKVDGSFLVFCSIHPQMELWVDVTSDDPVRAASGKTGERR